MKRIEAAIADILNTGDVTSLAPLPSCGSTSSFITTVPAPFPLPLLPQLVLLLELLL